MGREPGWQSDILILSDDLATSQARLLALDAWNIGGNVETSLNAAAARCADSRYDLLVIDVHTHDFDGIAACRHLRSLSANPLLLVAYADDERDKIAAYEAGVDEFVAKPIGLPLFVCKVQAWLRHSWTIPAALQQREIELQPNDLHASFIDPDSDAGVCLDLALRQIIVGPTAIPLSNLELRLLHVLIAHEGQVLSGEELLGQVWGLEGCNQGVLKNAVYRLRRKIAHAAPEAPRFLYTVRGKGYLFKVER